MNKALKNTLFVLVIDVTVLLALELILRATNPIPRVVSSTADTTEKPWGWSNQPNVTEYFTPPMFADRSIKIKAETDQLGYRNKGFNPSKPDGEYRIICMGDSSTYGWGVNYHEMFPVVLEGLIKQAFPEKNVSVYSMGVPGHTIVQGYVLYREQVKSFSPDLIIVSYGENDWHDIAETNHPSSHIQYYLEKPVSHKPEGISVYLRKSHIYRFMRAIPFIFHKHIINNTFLRSFLFQEAGIPAVNLLDFSKILGLWAQEARSAACNMVILRIGGFEDYAELMSTFAKQERAPFLDYRKIVEKHIAEILLNQRFEEERCFYMRAFGKQVIRETNFKHYYTFEDVHPTSIGHQLIAEELFDIMKSAPFDRSIPLGDSRAKRSVENDSS